MTFFRPCIDLHDGKVKQIVGGTLVDGAVPTTNFVSSQPPSHFAELYRKDGLKGGHVIQLGAGNTDAARAALAAWPDGLQLGGGVNACNAPLWIEAGASHVIVTSWLFERDGRFAEDKLESIVRTIGKDRLVIDLSCRGAKGDWVVTMNRWQTPTDLRLDHSTLDRLADSCAEFLIHAVDVEGKCEGMDEDLLAYLGAWGKIPVTYAGGARSVEDLKRADTLSGGKVDVTIGSALDIFGGKGARYEDCVAFNRRS